jgi:hypothetical protein
MENHPVDHSASAADHGGHLDRVAGQLRIRMLRGWAGQQLAENKSNTLAK